MGDQGVFDAVKLVSLSAEPTEIIDIVGPSGAGKSTLLHALALLIPRSTGSLMLNGVDAEDLSPQEWRSQVALVQQKPSLLEGTIKENLTLPWKLKIRKASMPPAEARLQELMQRAGLEEIALTREVSQLSVGQQARVAFMRTLLTNPSVMLLDEVDAALDAQSTIYIGALTSLFAKQGGMVIRVRHKIDDKRAHKRLSLDHGTGTLETLKRDGQDD